MHAKAQQQTLRCFQRKLKGAEAKRPFKVHVFLRELPHADSEQKRADVAGIKLQIVDINASP